MFNNILLYENDNNMNNTNTIKTILFASLIAAMILPFSTMNMSYAISAEDNIECEKKISQDLFEQISKQDKKK